MLMYIIFQTGINVFVLLQVILIMSALYICSALALFVPYYILSITAIKKVKVAYKAAVSVDDLKALNRQIIGGGLG